MTTPATTPLAPNQLQPGDVIINDRGDTVTVHSIHAYDTGALSIRYRYTCNPRGIDWSGFIGHDARLRLLSRGVASVDSNTRSMLNNG